MEFGFLSIIPPLVAITLAVVLKDPMIALFVAVFSGHLITSGFNPGVAFGAMLESIINVFSGRWAVIVILCLALAYGISRVIEDSGGAQGFVEYLTQKKQIIKNKKQAALFTWLIGVILYSNATLSMILTGVITKPINDKMGMSHEKQALIIKSTGPPVCGLIPVGQWGGIMLGLLAASGIENTAEMLVQVSCLNFYCIIVVFSLLVLLLTNKDFFSMKLAEERATKYGQLDDPRHGNAVNTGLDRDGPITTRVASPAFVFIPALSILVITIGYMVISGGGNPLKGDAVGGVLWGMVLSSIILLSMNVFSKNYKMGEVMGVFIKGMGEAMPIMIIMTISIALGSVVQTLGTGAYLASLFSDVMSPALLPAILFIITGFIGIATGSATGTLSTMFPIAIPWAILSGANLPLCIAAAWGAAFFGDHISPISDSTFMTAGIVGCDVFDHIKTITPYGMIWAGASLVCFLVAGFVL